MLTFEKIEERFDEGTDDDFVICRSKAFFMEYLRSAPSEKLSTILKFATGFAILPPWGLHKKICLKYFNDDECKVYPEAMACFNILYLPTIHITQNAFDHHFDKALILEGIGFSASY